ncbi:lipid A deacylase LpxR family protein [Elioraea sp.]|uniref:lipid A deacylase LpxR family protein n=1 Tax=Elioraea sp. TaxID=2185103 RepID=UPI003F7183EE
MNLRPMRPLLASLLGALATSALANEAPQPDPAATLNLTVENDLFGRTDKYYTSGFQLSWRSASADPPVWLAWMSELATPFFPPGGTPRWGLALGQNIYTPADTLARNPDLRDRPYAGWLYGAFTLISYTERTLGTFEVQFGVVGPAALGEQVQNNVHDLINVDRALGWKTQLKDEPGINVILNRQWRINQPLRADDPRGLALGLVPSLTVSLGNVQTYGSVGLMLRVGSNLQSDFGPPRIRPSHAGTAFFQPDGRWGWYVFAGVEGRAVARDIFLDGNTWRDSRRVDRIPFVGEGAIGAVLIMPWARLSYTHTFRGPEFRGQTRSAQYGSVSLSFRF